MKSLKYLYHSILPDASLFRLPFLLQSTRTKQEEREYAKKSLKRRLTLKRPDTKIDWDTPEVKQVVERAIGLVDTRNPRTLKRLIDLYEIEDYLHQKKGKRKTKPPF
jgi:hypothetical protein